MYTIKIHDEEATAVITGIIERINFCETRMAETENNPYWVNQRRAADIALSTVSTAIARGQDAMPEQDEAFAKQIIDDCIYTIREEIESMAARGVYEMAHSNTKKERMYLLQRDNILHNVKNVLLGAVRDMMPDYTSIPF